MNKEKIYLVNGKRTPFGKFGGSLMNISPVDLAVKATTAMLSDIGMSADKVDHFIFGNVVPTTTDAMYGGRHLGLKSGGRQEVGGYCVNRLCGSGIQVILDAVRMIKLGEAKAVVAAGAENMSNVPHLTYGSRFGTKYGSLKSVDMLLDALTDQYTGIPMGLTAEKLGEQFQISREDCDNFSYESHQKGVKAYENNYLQGEITPIELKKGVCDKDEHLRGDVDIDQMSKLRASFKNDGLVTPASASGIVDGAASVLIASETFCKENNLTPMAEILDGSVVGVDPTIMGIGPVPAIRDILSKNSLSIEQIDLIEINEAFAAQALACAKELKLDMDKLNIWGGAIALGHPLAASGTRISLTLARQLKEKKSKLGIAAACIGGGQGIAILLKNVD